MSKPVAFRNKWRIRWSDEHGKRRRAVFEDREEAAFRLRQEELRVEEVKRGLRQAKPGDRLCSELFDYWLKNRAPRKRSQRDDESIIRAHLRPAFGHLRLREVNVEHIDAFMIRRVHLENQTIRNHLTLLKTMMSLAVDLGWLRTCPKIRKPKVRLFNKDYRWLRTEDEVRRFLVAAEEDGPLVYALYITAIYTGMRLGELAALEWGDVDFKRRLITVARSINGATKAEDVRYVPILDALLSTLLSWRVQCPTRLVFPNQAGRMHDERGRVFVETLHRVLTRADFPTGRTKRGKVHYYISFHSLRHTFASHWVVRGGDLFKLQKILGHKRWSSRCGMRTSNRARSLPTMACWVMAPRWKGHPSLISLAPTGVVELRPQVSTSKPAGDPSAIMAMLGRPARKNSLARCWSSRTKMHRRRWFGEQRQPKARESNLALPCSPTRSVCPCSTDHL